MPKKILITGANGRIGKGLVQYLDSLENPVSLRLADLVNNDERGITINVADFSQCKTACEGVDIVIHLAGIASPDAEFHDVLTSNIVGTYNIFQAATEAQVSRVIYASSAQTIEGYPLDIQVKPDMPVRPKNLYGVSKAFGEAIAAYYAYQHHLETIAIRIGAFEYQHEWSQLNSRDLSAWSEPNDLFSLFLRCIETELDEPYMIAHGISDNRFKRLDLSETKQKLGYNPLADAFSTWNINIPNNSISVE